METHTTYATKEHSHGESHTRVMAKLKFHYGEAAFNSWLKPLTLATVDDTEVTLKAPTRFIRDWVTNHYREDILRAWKDEQPKLLNLQIVVDKQQRPGAVSDMQANAMRQGFSETVVGDAPQQISLGSELDTRLSFEQFVVGTSNQLAVAAAKNVAGNKLGVVGCNPLYIYGPAGSGKTHLLQAIAHQVQKAQTGKKVVYLTAERFMFQFIRALKNKDIMTFKEQCREIELFLVDDIQFICGKANTQEEFFHTFNALIDQGSEVVISGDRSPSELPGLDDRVSSRLSMGLVADIGPSDFDLRIGVLRNKAAQLGVAVPDNVLMFLAQKITSNIRELEGALHKVIAHGNLTGQSITIETTQALLADLLQRSRHTVTISDIQKAVAKRCHIKLSDMQSARRSRVVARPRQIAMYLAKKLTTHSLPEIGRQFGGKDHTTVLHAVRRIESLLQNDDEVRDHVEELTSQLQT